MNLMIRETRDEKRYEKYAVKYYSKHNACQESPISQVT